MRGCCFPKRVPTAPITTSAAEEGVCEGRGHGTVVAPTGQDTLRWNIDFEASLRKNIIFQFIYNAAFHVPSNCLTLSERTACSGCAFLLITF